MRKLMIAALAAVTAIAASAAGNGQKTKTATTRIDDSFFTSGGLFTGVNYWASHAGTYMWRRWDAETVEKDFAALSAQGVDTLRVFPLWPDFQPLTRMIGNIAPLTEGVLQNDMPLANPAGVDEEMMKRFRLMCDAAQRHNMKLVVGLITGWMSGRRFLPPALEDKNPISNPESIKWQVRFVRHFVREMRNHPAIAAWDLGNECNTFGGNRDELWGWMNAISSAIRAEDPSKPVVSGMHGITSNRSSAWNAYSQGELLDVLTTHPYPLFTPDCSREPFNTMRNELHGTVESLYYAGLSGRPCFIEEAGNLSANVASDARSAANARCAMINAWAHGLGGYLWWCAFDQTHLDFPPYTGSALERGLGILKADRSPKPVAKAMKEIRNFIDSFPYGKLPQRQIDAVTVLSEMEDFWPQALGSFVLAKEAGFDITFARAEGELPDAKLYILPSGSSDHTYTQTAWLRLLAKVKNGATLLVTKGNGFMLSDFLEITGAEIEYMHKGGENRSFELKSFPGRTGSVGDEMKTLWSARDCEVLASDSAGNPVMTLKPYGKGRVIAFNGPLEFDTAKKNDAFTGDQLNPRYLVYREAARLAGVKRVVTKVDSPLVGMTEHRTADGRTIVIAVNYEPAAVECAVTVNGAVGKVWRGGASSGTISINANDAAVFEVIRK